jgi:hypothetical protein
MLGPSRALKEEVSYGFAGVTCAFALAGLHHPDLGQIPAEPALIRSQLAECCCLLVWPVVVQVLRVFSREGAVDAVPWFVIVTLP